MTTFLICEPGKEPRISLVFHDGENGDESMVVCFGRPNEFNGIRVSKEDALRLMMAIKEQYNLTEG